MLSPYYTLGVLGLLPTSYIFTKFEDPIGKQKAH